MGIRPPRRIPITEPEPDEVMVAVEPETEPEPPETPEPSDVTEPEPETKPAEEPGTEPETEPELEAEPEPLVTASETEYSDEEWDALSSEERQQVWDDIRAEEEAEAQSRADGFTEREKKLKDDEAKLDRSKAEATRDYHDRMDRVKKLAEERDVSDEYGERKKIDRARRKDPSKAFDEVEIAPLIPEPKTPQQHQTNTAHAKLVRETLRTVGKALAPQLEVLGLIQDGMTEVGRVQESQGAWIKTTASILEESDIGEDVDVLSVAQDIADVLNAEKMTPLGSVMDEVARAATVRRILADIIASSDSTGRKPSPSGDGTGKVVKFRKPPPKARSTRKPPRRAPRTMGSRGGTADRPEPSKRSMMGDLAAGVDVD